MKLRGFMSAYPKDVFQVKEKLGSIKEKQSNKNTK